MNRSTRSEMMRSGITEEELFRACGVSAERMPPLPSRAYVPGSSESAPAGWNTRKMQWSTLAQVSLAVAVNKFSLPPPLKSAHSPPNETGADKPPPGKDAPARASNRPFDPARRKDSTPVKSRRL